MVIQVSKNVPCQLIIKNSDKEAKHFRLVLNSPFYEDFDEMGQKMFDAVVRKANRMVAQCSNGQQLEKVDHRFETFYVVEDSFKNIVDRAQIVC